MVNNVNRAEIEKLIHLGVIDVYFDTKRSVYVLNVGMPKDKSTESVLVSVSSQLEDMLNGDG